MLHALIGRNLKMWWNWDIKFQPHKLDSCALSFHNNENLKFIDSNICMPLGFGGHKDTSYNTLQSLVLISHLQIMHCLENSASGKKNAHWTKPWCCHMDMKWPRGVCNATCVLTISFSPWPTWQWQWCLQGICGGCQSCWWQRGILPSTGCL